VLSQAHLGPSPRESGGAVAPPLRIEHDVRTAPDETGKENAQAQPSCGTRTHRPAPRVPTVKAGEQEAAFLIAAIRREVARSSIRAVAKTSGVSHGSISNLASGKTRRLNGTTVTRLREWYLRQWAGGGASLTPDIAVYLMEEMLAAIASSERKAAALELVQGLERIYTSHGVPLPAWLSVARDEYQGTPGSGQVPARS
jgi:hypothetical protein